MTDSEHSSAPRALEWGQSLAAGVFCVAFLTLFQRAVGLGRSFVICDWLPTEELGRWDLALTFLMAVPPLLVLGIPGSFGRCVEAYRKTNRIGRFIWITATACALSFVVGVAILIPLSTQFGVWIDGNEFNWQWICILGATVTTVVIFNYVTSLMSALRLHSGFAKTQAIQGIGFAALCVLIVPWVGYQAIGVVAAYGVACVLSSIAAIVWIRRSLLQHANSIRQEASDFCTTRPYVAELVDVMRTLLPLAAAIWLATFIANGFRVSDRLMIVHLSSNEQFALYLIGQYHAARVFPRLLTQFAMMLSAMITPHLAEDWDRGQKERAAARLSSMLKLVSISFCGASIAILAFAPWLFEAWMHDKFDLANRLLPWTLASGILFSLAFVVQNAFWCTKRAWWTSLAFIVGLAFNVIAGVALFPRIGIDGIVISTFISTAATLGFMLAVASRSGFRFSRATYLFLALPSAMVAGKVGCVLILIVFAYALIAREELVTLQERQRVFDALAERFRKV